VASYQRTFASIEGVADIEAGVGALRSAALVRYVHNTACPTGADCLTQILTIELTRKSRL
jgi:hypothetical protein